MRDNHLYLPLKVRERARRFWDAIMCMPCKRETVWFGISEPLVLCGCTNWKRPVLVFEYEEFIAKMKNEDYDARMIPDTYTGEGCENSFKWLENDTYCNVATSDELRIVVLRKESVLCCLTRSIAERIWRPFLQRNGEDKMCFLDQLFERMKRQILSTELLTGLFLAKEDHYRLWNLTCSVTVELFSDVFLRDRAVRPVLK